MAARNSSLLAVTRALGVRWRKVARDLWLNKVRTLLVVMSVSVGVFGVGSIAHMNIIATRDLQASYDAVNPADAVLYTDQPFTDELLRVVRGVVGVRAADGRWQVVAQFQPPGETAWYPMTVSVAPDFERMQISKIEQEVEYKPNPEPWRGGAWPPPDRQIVLERSSLLLPTMGLGDAKIGDTIALQMPSGKSREMRIAGLAYDFGNYPAPFTGGALAFVSYESLEWLGEPRALTELDIVVDAQYRTPDGIRVVADRVKGKIENGGYTIVNTSLRTPGKLPLDFLFQAISGLLAVMGVMALFLSIFLVINTISAQVNQQVRQIGILKAIGGRTGQIASLYLGMVTAIGVLATVAAIPVALYATDWFVGFMSYFINFRLTNFHLPAEIIAFEFGIGLGVPLLAALFPVLGGTRLSVRDALNSYGLAASGGRATHAGAFSIWRQRYFPRTLTLSLRNTFRRKGRLSLTLLTLILAGTIFISIMNVNASLSRTLESALGYFQSDLWVILRGSYSLDKVESETRNVPGVTRGEGWGGTAVHRLRPDGTESVSIQMHAPPPGSTMIRPIVVDGRWLLPEDENAVVVTTELLREELDLAVGKTITLTFDTRRTEWHVVGIVRTAMLGPTVYVNYEHFGKVARESGRAGVLFAVTDRHDGQSQLRTSELLKTAFEDAGIRIRMIQTTEGTRDRIGTLFTIVFTMLMAMVILMATVGTLGLAGTMSLNVLERTREIGILRAIGASNGTIERMVIGEGILIGLLSWLFSAILAQPVGAVLASLVGTSMLQAPLEFVYSVDGALLWLGLVLVLAAVASYVPARNASHLTVREVLAYEG